MTTIKAHFDGKAFVPDEPVDLPPDQPVTVQVDAGASNGKAAPNRQELIERLGRIEEMAGECGAGEVDWSRDSIYSGNLDDPR